MPISKNAIAQGCLPNKRFLIADTKTAARCCGLTKHIRLVDPKPQSLMTVTRDGKNKLDVEITNENGFILRVESVPIKAPFHVAASKLSALQGQFGSVARFATDVREAVVCMALRQIRLMQRGDDR